MTWLLLAIAAILIGLGVWGGPRRRDPGHHPRQGPGSDPADPGDDPWAIITKPLERQEAIHIPEHRPWYLPGADRRFQRGLLVGLGSGLLVAAVASNFVPRGGLAQPPAAEAPSAAVPVPAPTPAITPPPEQTPAPAPAKPVNVTFVVELGDASPTIAAKLKEAGLIADEQAFVDRVAELGVDTSLKAGTFIIPTGAALDEVIGALTA